jgi:hypothetical protein
VPPARSVVASSIVLAASALTLLVGCATTAPAEGGGGDGGSGGDSGADAAAGPNCENVTTGGWELFVDPRLTVDPADEVVPLQKEGDVLAFVDTAPEGYTTYAYELGYVDDAGTVFPNDAEIFIGAEHTNEFQLDGPLAPSGVDGGPYAGIVQIDATNDAGTTTLARVCVLLATDD